MFGTEAEMKRPVAEWLAQQGLYVAEEFDTGWGICDLVGCAFDLERVAHRTRQRQRQPLGSAEAIFLYHELPDSEDGRRGVSARTLARRVAPYLGEQRVSHILEKLRTANHVRRTPSGAFLRVNGWAPLHRRLVAVELKLQRWTDVLQQARVNRAFAPESFIALPLESARRAERSELAAQLRLSGVGLLAVTRDGCTEMLPARTPADVTEGGLELWAAEQFWRCYRGRH